MSDRITNKKIKLVVEHKADQKYTVVSAASIIAKVYRDNLMVEMDKKFPLYGFSSHKGYGTSRHIEALKLHGPCEIHRKSFEPLASFLHTC